MAAGGQAGETARAVQSRERTLTKVPPPPKDPESKLMARLQNTRRHYAVECRGSRGRPKIKVHTWSLWEPAPGRLAGTRVERHDHSDDEGSESSNVLPPVCLMA